MDFYPMKKTTMRAVLSCLSLLFLLACSQTKDNAQMADAAAVAVNADVSIQQLETVLNAGTDIYLLDVRTAKEYETAHLAGTDDRIPYDSLAGAKGRLPADKATDIYVYCRTGRRSGIAATELRAEGYTNVHNVEGGITAWQAAGLPVQSGN